MVYSAIALTTDNGRTKESNRFTLILSNDLASKYSLVSLTHSSPYCTRRNMEDLYNSNEFSCTYLATYKTLQLKYQTVLTTYLT